MNSESRLSMMLKASVAAALTAALSLVTVPLPLSPVPITGQTLGVCLSGLILGPWWGAAAVATYLLLRVAGLPVFSGGRSGLGVILGPTGGYLLSFVPAAFVSGLIALGTQRRGPAGQSHKKRGPHGFARFLAASVVGSILVVHGIGSPYLAWHMGMSLREALLAGSVPFLPGDAAKALLAALVALSYHRRNR